MSANSRADMRANMMPTMTAMITPAFCEFLSNRTFPDEEEIDAADDTTELDRDTALQFKRVINDGQEAVFAEMLSNLANVNRPLFGEPLLYHVVAFGAPGMAMKVLARGASVTAVTRSGESVTHAAVQRGSFALVRMLVEKGAPIDAPTMHNITPLYLAYKGLNGTQARQNTFFPNRYQTAARPELTLDEQNWHMIITYLLANGANPNQLLESGRTPVIETMVWGDVELFEVLVGLTSLDLKTYDQRGHTCLCAALSDTLRINAARLISYTIVIGDGLAANAKCHVGHTALVTAASSQAFELMNILLQSGARADASLVSPLLVCADKIPLNPALLLINTGVNVDAQEQPSGDTALHRALQADNIQVSALLAAVGANVITRNAIGQSPLELVESKHVEAVAHAIEQHQRGNVRAQLVGDIIVREFLASGSDRLRAESDLRDVNGVYGRLKWLMLRRRIQDVCGALQVLQWPSLVLLLIIDELVPFADEVRMGAKWDAIVVVRHYHDRLRAAEQAAIMQE